jgi:sulfate-transporting ATPase
MVIAAPYRLTSGRRNNVALRCAEGRCAGEDAPTRHRTCEPVGAERNGVHLAKMARRNTTSFCWTNQPTNDLDVDTPRAPEGALTEFAGCVVIISRDRWFLDRLATHVLAFKSGGLCEWFEGNFRASEADKRRCLGADPTQPHRIKYRPLAW